jgi:hypothetical protein
MDPRGAHHSGNVRRGRSHVCCVDADLAAIGPHARKIPSPAFGTSRCRGLLLNSCGVCNREKCHSWHRGDCSRVTRKP